MANKYINIANGKGWVVAAVLVTAAGCSKDAENCLNLSNCVPPDAGQGGMGGNAAGGVSATGATGGSGETTASGGTSSAGGSGTGGVTSACSPACSGAKPVCNEPSKTCVQCLGDGNCAGATPACNTTSHQCVECTNNEHCPASAPLCDAAANHCVECLTSADCTDPAAAACVSGTCEPCSSHADCAHLAGKTVCKLASDAGGDAGSDAGASAGECVECTGTNYAACQGAGNKFVCDSLKHTCSTTAIQGSAGLCQPCVSDAQCAPGQLCAEQLFNGQSVGYFCFYKQGETGAPADCANGGRPYVKVWSTTSIDEQRATLCGLVVTTCIALNQFRQTDCTASGVATDTLCGFESAVDSKCALYGSTQHRCTVVCLSDDDCKPGVSCNTAVNPNVCNLQ